jgi:hypothetical protein
MQITLPAPVSRWSIPLLIGTACIVAGGFVAAVTAASPSEKGAWVAAYLVLVVGVAQIALGAGQAWLAREAPPAGVVAAELAIFNLGNAAVIGGTLADTTWIVDIGGVLLIAALTMYLGATRSARGGWPLLVYRVLIAFVLISIPVGLMLARLAD